MKNVCGKYMNSALKVGNSITNLRYKVKSDCTTACVELQKKYLLKARGRYYSEQNTPKTKIYGGLIRIEGENSVVNPVREKKLKWFEICSLAGEFQDPVREKKLKA